MFRIWGSRASFSSHGTLVFVSSTVYSSTKLTLQIMVIILSQQANVFSSVSLIYLLFLVNKPVSAVNKIDLFTIKQTTKHPIAVVIYSVID